MQKDAIEKYIKNCSDPKLAEQTKKFFKLEYGAYGYGDMFLGIRVPHIRKIAKDFRDEDLEEIDKVLESEYHELRLFALLVFVEKFIRGDEQEKKIIYDRYLCRTRYVNNWDLVDLTAHKIVGEYLLGRDRKDLYALVKSKSLWDRRIAIVATLQFIRNNQFQDTFKISEILLKDQEDLIHKAVGWMLREVGKKNEQEEVHFLNKYHKIMPRTMLRYAIERFEKKKRLRYLLS